MPYTKRKGETIVCLICEETKPAPMSRRGRCKDCHQDLWLIRKGEPPARTNPPRKFTEYLESIEQKITCLRCKIIKDRWGSEAGVCYQCRREAGHAPFTSDPNFCRGCSTRKSDGEFRLENPFGLELRRTRCSQCKADNHTGLSRSDRKKLLENFSGLCECCGEKITQLSSGPSGPHIDHCHTSGKIRGIICSSCNTALGLIKDSVKRCIDMKNYLEERG